MDMENEGRGGKILSTEAGVEINGLWSVIPGLELVIHSLPGVIHYIGGKGHSREG